MMISPDDFGALLRTGTDEAKTALYHRMLATPASSSNLASLIQGLPDSWNGFPSLHNCVNDSKFFQLLVQKGADPTVRDAEGITTLMLAVQHPPPQNNNNSVLHYLLHELGTATTDRLINARDHLGRTALFWALRSGNHSNNNNNKTVQLLLQRGANPNLACHDGTTPLLEAIQQRQQSVATVQLLQQYGANLHVTDQKGNNALHYAAQTGHTDLVQWLLLLSGTNSLSLLTRKNHAGKTPLDVVLGMTTTQPKGNNNNNSKPTTAAAAMANLLLERYQNQIVAQEGDLVLHSILETAVFVNTTTIEVPLGTLSVDQFLALLHGLVTKQPHCLQTVNADGAGPLHVVCQNNSHTPPPRAVLQFLMDQDPTAVRRTHPANGNLPLSLLLQRTAASSSLSMLETVQFMLDQYPAAITTMNHQRQTPLAVAATSLASSVEVLFHLLQAHPGAALASFR